ncbi:Thioredoxin [uncultured virus]|nr:Thioredoxin [uncultured virus]
MSSKEEKPAKSETHKVELVEVEDRFDTLIESKGLVIVDWFAQWCGPCKRIAPEIEKLAAANKDVTFCKVDVDVLEDLAATYDVTAMPTFMAFREGKKLGLCKGADLKQVEALVKKHNVSTDE